MRRLIRLELEDYVNRFADDSVPPGEYALSLPEAADLALPRRESVSHKYTYGRALVIAGSRGYAGAPVLAANACERSGAGLTRLVVPESIYVPAAARIDGAVATPLRADENGAFARGILPEVLPLLGGASACVIGPGIGTAPGAGELTALAVREFEGPLILDADALTLCGKNMALLRRRTSPVILTPHEGEFRRLGGDLSAGRLAGALAFTAAFPNVILVLKGHGTLVCRGREVTVNPTGGPAMAKGGSGDVLAGILCALLAQGFEPLFAARCAVYLHGLAGDLAAGALGEYSVTPSDLIRCLPEAFKSVTA